MTDSPTSLAAPARRIDGLRLVLLAGLAVWSAVLLWKLIALAEFGLHAFAYPFSLDYGEGIVWQQTRDIVAGTAYGPLGVYPAVVYHYPPFFHVTAAAAAWVTGLDQLVAGRLVEVVSTIASALLVYALTFDALDGPKPVRRLCAALAGLLFLTFTPVAQWALLMRVDMLSGALGLAGIWLAVRADRRPALIYAAALAFVLSVYTKQTSLAAPAAVFLVLLVVRPKLAWRGIIAATLLGLAALAVLSWVSDGGFLRHILLYNINRVAPGRLWFLWGQLLQIAGVLIVAAFGAVFAWRRALATNPGNQTLAGFRQSLRSDPTRVTLLILLAFLVLKTLMLLMIMKSGSSSNYFLEWLSAVAIFACLGLRPAVAWVGGGAQGRRISPLLLVAIVVIAPYQATQIRIPSPAGLQNAGHVAELNQIVERIRHSPKPVISDEMTLLLRAGQDVAWEPAIMAELGHSGVYDQRAFVAKVRAGEFGFFVTTGQRGDRLFDERYNREVAEAIEAAYPRTETVAGRTLHLPAR